MAKQHEKVVNASKAGWIWLIKLSLMEAITLAPSIVLLVGQIASVRVLVELSTRMDLLQRPADGATPDLNRYFSNRSSTLAGGRGMASVEASRRYTRDG